MSRTVLSGIVTLALLAGCSDSPPVPDSLEPPTFGIAESEKVSGSTFLTDDSRALQDDDFANPGLLWVDRGEALFGADHENAPSCSSCHTEGMSGVAARYPAYDEETDQLLNLEGRINQCRTDHQGLQPLTYESDDLLALTAYIASQSRGMPLTVELDPAAIDHFENGETYFMTKRGQFNFSCQQCHDETWGKRIRGDTISQGHGNGFPAYRFEWEGFGSLHRRLHDCDTGVRAEPFPLGSETYVDLEYYLAIRASGLPIESPGIRR